MCPPSAGTPEADPDHPVLFLAMVMLLSGTWHIPFFAVHERERLQIGPMGL
jgi:hypothetical protein